jgi:hypothetical protein
VSGKTKNVGSIIGELLINNAFIFRVYSKDAPIVCENAINCGGILGSIEMQSNKLILIGSYSRSNVSSLNSSVGGVIIVLKFFFL